jgi:glycyl-tRNA synthetase
VDGESAASDLVTVRERDSLAQERVSTSQLEGYLAARLVG